MNKIFAVAAFGAVAIVAAFASAAPDPKLTASAQIDQGKKLYTEQCSKCHGAAGQGTKDAPAVVGKDAFPLDPRPKAKRDVKFHTAADVFAWASKHMPAKNPGSLTTDQYLAIFAFDLTANGIKLDQPLDGPAAAKIVLHP
ncbi:MAG TPA: c-type cytochrome [Kofleriaceae bacterium]|jgi:mono/diheme cytochrome c family protein